MPRRRSRSATGSARPVIHASAASRAALAAASFDAVVSALAIHNIGTAAIPRVYRDIFTLLRPGGCFFDADLAFPAGPGEADLYRRDPVRDPRWDVYTGLPGLEDHLRWLREAGFSEAACLWKDCEDTLLWALRSQ